jgi:hypothetical protein
MEPITPEIDTTALHPSVMVTFQEIQQIANMLHIGFDAAANVALIARINVLVDGFASFGKNAGPLSKLLGLG